MQRRQVLKSIALAGATLGLTAATRNQVTCETTPRQPEGPFYPIKDQLDKDADLVTLVGKNTRAQGTVIYISGTVLAANVPPSGVGTCQPLAGALVEIWQACHTGKYNHPSDTNPARLDPEFQYWGKAVTDADGFYRFRTIIPGAYPADVGWVRPPHIHFKVQKLGYHELITQLYFAGHLLNGKDRILSQLPESEKLKVVVPLRKQTNDDPIASFNINLVKV